MSTTANYGWTKPVVGGDSSTWGTELNTTLDSIDSQVKTNDTNAKNASNINAGTLGSAYGGAGTISGLLKANGSGVVSAAVSATDYAPATTGSAILKANAGGFAAAVAKTDYVPATTGSAIQKADGSGGLTAAVSKTDYVPATSGSAVQKADGSGGLAAATDGTDFVSPTGTMTLTNKRVTKRVVAAGATTGTITPNSDTTDLFKAEGLTGSIVVATPSGTPTDGQPLMMRFKDNGTARALDFSAYTAIGVTAPTTTVLSKWLYVMAVYNGTDSAWHLIGTAEQ